MERNMKGYHMTVPIGSLGIPIGATLAQARLAMSESDQIGSMIDGVPVTRTVRVSFLWRRSQREWSDTSRWLVFYLCSLVGLSMLVLDDGGKGMGVRQPKPELVS